jgi:hypothetical protein
MPVISSCSHQCNEQAGVDTIAVVSRLVTRLWRGEAEDNVIFLAFYPIFSDARRQGPQYLHD